MNIPTTGAAPAATFDPADWLSRFESFGGGYALTPKGLNLCILVYGQDEHQVSQARQMITGLSDDAKQALAEHLHNASEPCPDSALIERTYQQWKDEYQHYNRLPIPDGEGDEAEDTRLMDHLGELEDVIRAGTATTPRAVAAQLWIALKHTMTKRDEEAAILREDINWLSEREERFCWEERLVLAALRSLNAMDA